MRAGRPLRFVATMLGGWAALRVAVLWGPAFWQSGPVDQPLATVTAKGAITAEHTQSAPIVADLTRSIPSRAPTTSPQSDVLVRAVMTSKTSRRRDRNASSESAVAETPPLQAPDASEQAPANPVTMLPASPSLSSRWSATAWAIVRGGGTQGGIASPELGGSQAGVRVAYALDEARRFAVYGRAASAIEAPQQEAAVGVEWRLPGVPIRLIAEQRIAIRNARPGPAVGLVGGVSAVPLPGGARLDGYGQAGVILRGGERYADGSIRIAKAVHRIGPLTVEAGGGTWGAAQRGASRADAGPFVAVAGRGARASLEWRQRLAGNARPASGPALTLGADF